MVVHFQNADRKPVLNGRRWLKKLLGKILAQHKTFTTAHITFIFCSDDYLLNINQQFLAHDTYTDIITFDLSDNPNEIQAEVYISIDRVKENANSYHTTVQKELLRVIFHGILHLSGFDDHTPTEKLTMRKLEEECLDLFEKQTAIE